MCPSSAWRSARFLSTLSLRRATASNSSRAPPTVISIHALLAESDFALLGTPDTWTISIHALLAESDKAVIMSALTILISIHALLAESDLTYRRTRRFPGISIHALLAESDVQGYAHTCRDTKFLSTLSLRRATASNSSRAPPTVISIHALLAESDRRGAISVILII